MADDLNNINIGINVETADVSRSIKLFDRMKRDLADLELKRRQQVLTDKEYNRGLQQMAIRLGKMTGNVNNAKSAMMQYNYAIKNATDAQLRFASVSGKGMRRLEVLAQQAGYQIGDLAVQIQSGTNAAVALGQQGSQLLGFFGPKGAIAGAALAIGTGLIAPLLKAQKEAKNTQTAFENIEKALDQIDDINIGSNLRNGLLKVAKEVRQEFEVSLSIVKQLAAETLKTELAKPLQTLRDELKKFETGRVLGLDKGFDILGFSDIERFTQAYEILSKIQGDTREELQKSVEEAGFWLRGSGLLNEEVKKLLAQYVQVVGTVDSVNKAVEDATDAEADRIDRISETEKLRRKLAEDRLQTITKAEELHRKAAREREEEAAKIKAIYDAQVVAVGNEVALQSMIKQFGEESFAVQRLRKDIELENYEIQLRQKGIQGEQLQNLIDQKAAALGLKQEMSEIAALAKETLSFAPTPAVAKALEKYAGRGTVSDKDPIFGSTGKSIYNEPKREKVLKNIQDTIDALREQTKHETKLLGLTGERLKEEEIYYDLVLKNKDADIKLSDKKLRAIAKEIAAQQEANEMYKEAIQFVDGISDAFSDFIAGGLKDFKSFVSSIKDMFVRLLADLAAQAIRNRILIPIATGFMAGAGNATAGTIAGAGAGGMAAGTIGATLATGASALGAGFTTSLGFGTTTTGATAMALNPTMSSIGSALPTIIAVAAVVGLLTKKTKLLDSGLRATVEGFDVAIETFQLTQSSRLFGLLKGKKVTSYGAAPAEIADPIVEAIGDMQQSIIDAAGTLGIGSAAFDDFSYQFKLSLKGLTEEEQLQKINEEITKMGDAFASLSGHFETMNELLAVAQQRYDLETRLLQLQGNETELLIRQRERERTATHELNQTLLDQIYAIEDAQIAATKSQMVANQAVAQADAAFATVQRSIQARKDSITRSFNEIMETIQNRIEAANENVSVSRGILSSLEGASSARIGMSRGAGLSYLSELRGASRITDQKMLDKALDAVANPSKGLYSSFVEYQRDFADQSNIIRDLEEKASYQLDTDEKTLIQLQEEAKRSEERYEAQIDKLDEQLEAAQNQINALKGIDTSVKSVEAAIAGLGASIQAAVAAQARAAAAAAAVRTVAAATGGGSGGGGSGGGGSGGGAVATKAAQAGLTSLGTYSAATAKAPPSASFVASNTGKAYYQIRGESQLLTAAQSFGIQTTGKTGTQLQDSIARITNSIVNMDNKTRAKQFAMGGMFGGGVRMVGERGPELEATGPSRIFSTKQTAELFRNPELVAEVKNLRAEVAGLRSEQRQLQASNSKYVKRNYDINRKWDTEGLPATRT